MGGVGAGNRSLVPSKSWYAWIVALGGFCAQLVTIFGFSTFGIIITVIADDLNTTVTALAVCSSVFGVTYSGFGFIWGWLADRFGIRIVLTAASTTGSLMLVLMGIFSHSVFSLTVFYGLVGAFYCGLTAPLMVKLITNWFAVRWRGKGIAVALLGGSLGGAAIGVIAPILVSAFNGWQGCMIALGCTGCVIGLVIFGIVRNSPLLIGTVRFGDTVDSYLEEAEAELIAKAKSRKNKTSGYREILRMGVTYKIGIVLILIQLVMTANKQYMVASAVFYGFDLTVAALCWTVCSACKSVSQVVFPSLTDRFCRKNVLALLLVLRGLANAPFFFSLGTGKAEIVLACAGLIGICDGITPVYQVTISEQFPPHLRACGTGVATTMMLVGRFFGPILAGYAIIASNGFTPAYLPFISVVAFTAALAAFALLPKTGGRYGDWQAARSVKEALQSE